VPLWLKWLFRVNSTCILYLVTLTYTVYTCCYVILMILVIAAIVCCALFWQEAISLWLTRHRQIPSRHGPFQRIAWNRADKFKFSSGNWPNWFGVFFVRDICRTCSRFCSGNMSNWFGVLPESGSDICRTCLVCGAVPETSWGLFGCEVVRVDDLKYQVPGLTIFKCAWIVIEKELLSAENLHVG